MPPSLSNTSDCQAVIFDLDGTLVDSSVGILHSLAHAFHSHGITPLVPLEPSLIGPPLRETITALSADIDIAKSDAIIESFKSHFITSLLDYLFVLAESFEKDKNPESIHHIAKLILKFFHNIILN